MYLRIFSSVRRLFFSLFFFNIFLLLFSRPSVAKNYHFFSTIPAKKTFDTALLEIVTFFHRLSVRIPFRSCTRHCLTRSYNTTNILSNYRMHLDRVLRVRRRAAPLHSRRGAVKANVFISSSNCCSCVIPNSYYVVRVILYACVFFLFIFSLPYSNGFFFRIRIPFYRFQKTRRGRLPSHCTIGPPVSLSPRPQMTLL